MQFTITYADANDARPVRSDSIEADDIDAAAQQAVNTCPEHWFVVKVEQSDADTEVHTAHSPTFQRYIEHGERAASTHADYDTLDPATTATDTIAAVLHWAEDVWDARRDGGAFDAMQLLGVSHTTYIGDFEDDELAPVSRSVLVTRTNYTGAPMRGATSGWIVVDEDGKPLTRPYGTRAFAESVVAWFGIPSGLAYVALEWPGA